MVGRNDFGYGGCLLGKNCPKLSPAPQEIVTGLGSAVDWSEAVKTTLLKSDVRVAAFRA